MKTVKLKEICSLIGKGYEADKIDLENKLQKGIKINKINYSDISNGKESKNINQKIILKEKELLYKYKPKDKDLILPSTVSSSVNTKILLEDDQSSTIYDSIYSSNIVIMRLSNENSNFATTMYYLFNLETMKEKLLENVYSQGKIKAISLNKLRNFEVPIVTEEILEAIDKMVTSKKKLENLINDILS